MAAHPDLPIQQPNPQLDEAFRLQVRVLIEEQRDLIQQLQAKQQLDPTHGKERYEKDMLKLERTVSRYNKHLQQDPLFGYVLATSGYRVDKKPVPGFRFGCTLDWGLFEVNPARQGSNKVSLCLRWSQVPVLRDQYSKWNFPHR